MEKSIGQKLIKTLYSIKKSTKLHYTQLSLSSGEGSQHWFCELSNNGVIHRLIKITKFLADQHNANNIWLQFKNILLIFFFFLNALTLKSKFVYSFFPLAFADLPFPFILSFSQLYETSLEWSVFQYKTQANDFNLFETV